MGILNKVDNNLRKLCYSVTLAASAILIAPDLLAETDSTRNRIRDERFSLYLGGFFPQVNSGIRLDSNLDIGGDVSFEETLGLEDSDSVLWGGAIWRISRRNQLEFEYFQLNRSGGVRAVTDPFPIGNSLVQAGAQVESKFDVGIGRLTYGFAFVEDERKALTLKAGLHWASVDAAVKLTGAIIDTQTNQTIIAGSTITEQGEVSAPLPHLGLSFSYSITPKLLARAQGLGFALNVGDYSGSLIDAGVDLAYSPWRHFGFGAGIRYFAIRLEAENNRLDGEFDFNYWGPTLFGVVSF
jgi:hypothetical protein